MSDRIVVEFEKDDLSHVRQVAALPLKKFLRNIYVEKVVMEYGKDAGFTRIKDMIGESLPVSPSMWKDQEEGLNMLNGCSKVIRHNNEPGIYSELYEINTELLDDGYFEASRNGIEYTFSVAHVYVDYSAMGKNIVSILYDESCYSNSFFDADAWFIKEYGKRVLGLNLVLLDI